MMSNELNLEAFNKLSDEEKKVALDILKQYASEGNSDLLEKIKYADFDEIPVDIHTFLHDKNYLGRALYDAEGRFTLFPYWEERLHDIFPDNLTTKYNNIILTGCLAYDTEIPLLNGKVEKIGDLAKNKTLDEYVYSYDVETNSYAPGHLVDAFSTGVKPIYEIELDNGTVIKATSNHKFMTRDKHWKSIDTGLAIGDSMMPFNRTTKAIANRSGYEVIENPNKDGTSTEVFTHRLVMEYKRGKYSGVVHHKDFNKRNNDPRNLLLTDWIMHKMYHAKRGGDHFKEFNERRKAKQIPQEVEQAILDGGLKGCINRWSNQEEHLKISKLTTARMNAGFAKQMSNVVWTGKNAEINKQKVKANITTANKNNVNNYQISKAIKISNLALLTYGELTEQTYEQTKLDKNMRCGYPSFKSILARISYEDLLVQAQSYNHKIIRITYIGEEEVFDLTVEKYHNFAINNGIIAHNSIGIGKSTIAVICLLYLLYRLLCLKDPYLYYGMQPFDKISISLMNITLENAKGVALDKMNQMILASNWFMAHGEMAGETNLTYRPEKHIEMIVASSNNQVIGRALFCLDGNTEICTANGIHKMKDLVDKDIQVISIDDSGQKCLSNHCTIKPTLKTNEEFQIELLDGTIIKCTPNHKLRLIDGTYKEAQYLTESDELMDIQCTYIEYINNIIKNRGQWGLEEGYEGHHIIPKCLGGNGNTKAKHKNIVRLLPEEHYIAHKLLAIENPDNRSLVNAWEMMAYPKGKTKRTYPISAEDYALLCKLWSKHMRENNPGLCNNGHPWNYDIGIKKEKKFIYINNGQINKQLKENMPIPEGFVRGRIKPVKQLLSKEQKHAIYSAISSGKNNPMYQKGYKITNGNNGHAVTRYFINGLTFESGKELIEYLLTFDTKISNSTIRKLKAGSNRVLREHPILKDVSWEAK